MNTVLVGLLGESRVYYNLDAAAGERDAVVEKPDGSSMNLSIIQIGATARNLTKLRSTPFQRFLWDAPKNPTSGAWYETFIEKTRPVSDELLGKKTKIPSTKKAKKKLDKTNRSAKSFINAEIEKHMLTKSCCGEMIKLNVNIYDFKTAEERDFAWEAMKLLRQIEEQENVD